MNLGGVGADKLTLIGIAVLIVRAYGNTAPPRVQLLLFTTLQFFGLIWMAVVIGLLVVAQNATSNHLAVDFYRRALVHYRILMIMLLLLILVIVIVLIGQKLRVPRMVRSCIIRSNCGILQISATCYCIFI